MFWTTSTWSPGRMKPATPVSTLTGVAMARMPVGNLTAMKPACPPLTSLRWLIGSLAIMATRTREPATDWIVGSPESAFWALSTRPSVAGPPVMNCGLTAFFGQGCQATSSGVRRPADRQVVAW